MEILMMMMTMFHI